MKDSVGYWNDFRVGRETNATILIIGIHRISFTHFASTCQFWWLYNFNGQRYYNRLPFPVQNCILTAQTIKIRGTFIQKMSFSLNIVQ